jgi:arylsulfatase B
MIRCEWRTTVAGEGNGVTEVIVRKMDSASQSGLIRLVLRAGREPFQPRAPQPSRDNLLIMQTHFLRILTALCGTLFALVPAQAANEKPNILYIVADDLGWKDVGFNGATDIKTPNLDKLAAGGAKLTQFYVQPMCTPTRAALMTGRYPFRYGLQTAVIPSVSTYGLDTSEWLMPQALKEAGYKTAIIGKWHLGHADKKYWPRQRGFDYQYGAMIGELDYFSHDEHGVLDWFRNNEPVKEEGYTTTLIGNDAVKYINEQNPAAPFYLYLAFNAPHTPYQAPQEYIDRYKNIADPTRRTYAAMVTCLDDEIGRVVAALDKKGLRENTLIVFHSDNGGTRNAMFAGVMADMSKIKIPCDNGPYREGKGALYEGATRVCAFANWPGHIKSGSSVDGFIHAVDMYPTLAALAGVSTARCKPLDGVDVWPVISEGKPSPRTEMSITSNLSAPPCERVTGNLSGVHSCLPRSSFTTSNRTQPRKITLPRVTLGKSPSYKGGLKH